jgi:RimJ/RimL family protein N-acetyltransferase
MTIILETERLIFATEALIGFLDYGFCAMKIDVVNAYTYSQNGASNHVLR